MITLSDNEKRQLSMLAAATVALLALFWYFVIRNQETMLRQTREQMAKLQSESSMDRMLAEHWESYGQRQEATSNALAQLEANLPANDIFMWQLRAFLKPKTKGVAMISVEPPKLLEPLLATATNYYALSFLMSGKAAYHDFGQFLADTENEFIHARLQHLELEPTMPDALDTSDARKLLFQLELITLSKTPPPKAAE